MRTRQPREHGGPTLAHTLSQLRQVRHHSSATRVRVWAAVLSVGALVAAFAAASPAAAAPLHAGATAASRHHVTMHGRHNAGCTKAANGHLLACPHSVRLAQLPAGVRDHAIVKAPVKNLATLVDTRTWTSNGGNTYPGAEVPFGMVQWSPDTLPTYNAGGGYQFGDEGLWGYSLTHISGPGCGAAMDLPILPMTGAMPGGAPSQATTSFTNNGEVAQAGYYSAQSNLPDTITSQFTATPHSSFGRFTFPKTTMADFNIKLMASQNGDAATTAKVIGKNEVEGSATSGDFCGETNNAGQNQLYTVHFDIRFSQPFTKATVVDVSGEPGPDSVFLQFDTTKNPVIDAKVGISYVSDANARLNWRTDNSGWDFSAVRAAAQASWNSLLSKISVWGGSFAQTQQFYSLLYKDFMQPNITSDVNGQFWGSDMKLHTLAPGQHDQYGVFSGWDTYHSLSQLQAILDPAAASDQAQSLLNMYAENSILPEWGYLNLDNFVMVGDSSDSIISDYYAFGARHFNLHQALADMLKQADTVNPVRAGEALEAKYGYLPEDGSYGCCGMRGYVSTLLELDSEDFALSRFAAALGDHKDAAMLQQRANNWVNVYDGATQLLNPKFQNGTYEAGVGPTTTNPYVEGDAYQYLWDVPNDYAGLFSLLGGNAKAAPMLRQYLSEPNGFGMNAQLTNEFDMGEQNAPDYAGDPAGTQQAVDNIRNSLYMPGPMGLPNNDDLGANSSSDIWDMLGMYPENSGSDNMVFSSPGFPHAVITLPNGRAIESNAPGASPSTFYVKSLMINGKAYNKLFVPFSTLANGSTMDWTMSKTATSWGSAAKDAPPSYGPVFAATATAGPATIYAQPGATTKATVTVTNLSSTAENVTWMGTPSSSGLTLSPSSGTLAVPGNGSATASVNVTAGSTDGDFSVMFTFKAGTMTVLPVQINAVIAKPGDLGPYFNITGISNDGSPTTANYDGDGFSYSEQALTAAGLAPGATVTNNGFTYMWPNVPASMPDSVAVSGQTIPVSTASGASSISFLGSATNSGSSGASGMITINYSDGTSSTATLGFSDWTLGAGSFPPIPGNMIVGQTPYRNMTNGQSQTVTTYVFSEAVPIDPSKTVTSITLPATTSNGSIGIFAVSTG
ncbi:MAG TPA: GH92 family glycosyl hydrolase [Streptosporangiaceae bacterium]|nr:GH92 family glycosyl hydrolase [Streptosporangiaceae bacterium]